MAGHRVTLLTLAAACALTLAACTTTSGDDAGEAGAAPSTPMGEIETVADGLDAPWSMAFHDGVALVSERDTARILEISETGPREVAIVDEVSHGGEGGLLGLATHDEYLYAYFTAENGNRVERFELTGSPGALTLGAAETIISGIPAAGNHNGGRIAFGPDGMLYVTTGDAGQPASAQDTASLAGKILRLTPEGAVPPDNPHPASPVYTLGHRNPQGLAWAEDGTLYASEFGQNTWDELNVIEPGANYGWPTVEGIAGVDGFTDPVQQWEPADASPSGIAIAGNSIFVANLRGERLREVPLSELGDSVEHFAGEYGRLRDAVVAPDGSLWVLTNNTDGRGSPAQGDDRILRIPLDALSNQ